MAKRRDDHSAVRAVDLSIGGPGGLRIVDGASFVIEPGEILVVSGPTGAGKSTLADMIAGAAADGVSVIGGEAIVGGVSVRRPGRRGRREWQYATGHLPQNAGAGLPPRLTVSEIIASPILSRSHKVSQRALSVRVASLLDEMHLPLGTADKYPYELSAGMLQRVAFAHAVVLDPKLLVADEPMANLDVEVRHVVYDAIRRRQRSWQLAALLVTNDPDLARELNAKTLTLRGGTVVGVGDYRDIPRPPSTSAIALPVQGVEE